MGILACKYFDDVGFVGLRIKERPKKPNVYIRNSYFGGMERVYLWDDVLRYSEGMNEHGVTILSNNFVNERVGSIYAKKFINKKNLQSKQRQIFELTNNIQIRKALFSETPKEALDILTTYESLGVSIVFNASECFLLKSVYLRNEYLYSITEVSKEDVLLQVLPLMANRDFDEFIRQLKITREYNEFFKFVVPDLRTENTSYESLMIASRKSIHFRPVNCNAMLSTSTSTGSENKLTFSIVKKEINKPYQIFDLYK